MYLYLGRPMNPYILIAHQSKFNVFLIECLSNILLTQLLSTKDNPALFSFLFFLFYFSHILPSLNIYIHFPPLSKSFSLSLFRRVKKFPCSHLCFRHLVSKGNVSRLFCQFCCQLFQAFVQLVSICNFNLEGYNCKIRQHFVNYCKKNQKLKINEYRYKCIHKSSII